MQNSIGLEFYMRLLLASKADCPRPVRLIAKAIPRTHFQTCVQPFFHKCLIIKSRQSSERLTTSTFSLERQAFTQLANSGPV